MGARPDSIQYDPSNRRYKKVTGGVTTHYIWQGSQVIAEYDGSTGAVTAEYVYSGSRMIAKIASGTTQYFLSDRLSERLALDTSGNVLGRQGHLPFGEDFGESGSQEKHHFTSYERDGESGTDYAFNRCYSPTSGRFITVDPLLNGLRSANSRSCKGGKRSGSPQTSDGYSYALNDPANRTDPRGLWPCGSSLFGGFLWSAISFDSFSHIDPLADFLACNPITPLVGSGSELFESECNCTGTEDCSFYSSMCKKTGGKTEAAIAYYCGLAKLACAIAGHSCTANCIRQSLQDLDVELNCINSKTNQDFANCEAKIHAIAYSVCFQVC